MLQLLAGRIACCEKPDPTFSHDALSGSSSKVKANTVAAGRDRFLPTDKAPMVGA